MIAATVALLTLAGIPFFSSFTGMITVDQGIIKLGGAASLAGALIWLGNILAVLGCARIISSAFRTKDTTDEESEPVLLRDSPLMREGIALLIPTVLLLLIGIAPELLLISNGNIAGSAQLAAASLLNTGITIDNITTSTFGFSTNGVFWLPGLFWGLALVTAAIIAFATGLTRTNAVATPAFVGGEPYETQSLLTFGSWTDLGNITQLPFVLPGPRSWRSDLNENEDELVNEDDLFEDSEVEEIDIVEVDVEEFDSSPEIIDAPIADITSERQPSPQRRPSDGKGGRNG